MFNLKHKLSSFFIKRRYLVVLVLVYLGILVAIYLASPPPGQAVRPWLTMPARTVGFPLVAMLYVVVSLIIVVLLFTLKRKSWKEVNPLNSINPLWFFFVVGLYDVFEHVIQSTFTGAYAFGHVGPDKIGTTLIQNLPGWIIPGALISMPMILYSYIWKRWNRRSVHLGIVLCYIGAIIAINFYQYDFDLVVDVMSFIWILFVYVKLLPFVAILLTKNWKQRMAVVLALIVPFVAFHQFMFVHQAPQRSLLKLSVDVKDVPSGEITVDGDFADWGGFQPIYVGLKGDSEDPSLDIREVFAATNRKELFIAVKTIESFDPSENKSIHIELDTDSDYQRDYSVSNELKDKEERVIVRDNLMANRGEGVIEFRVPLENIEIKAEKIAINAGASGSVPYTPDEWATYLGKRPVLGFLYRVRGGTYALGEWARYDESDWIFLRVK